MDEENKRMEMLLRDELDYETKKIIREVDADESLKNIVLPEDMDTKLQAKLDQYDAELEIQRTKDSP